jgi:hypothetical protein
VRTSHTAKRRARKPLCAHSCFDTSARTGLGDSDTRLEFHPLGVASRSPATEAKTCRIYNPVRTEVSKYERADASDTRQANQLAPVTPHHCLFFRAVPAFAPTVVRQGWGAHLTDSQTKRTRATAPIHASTPQYYRGWVTPIHAWNSIRFQSQVARQPLRPKHAGYTTPFVLRYRSTSGRTLQIRDKRTSSHQSPRITASFFARLQPLIRNSALKASSRVANAC